MDIHSLIMIPIVNLVAYQLNPVHASRLWKEASVQRDPTDMGEDCKLHRKAAAWNQTQDFVIMTQKC